MWSYFAVSFGSNQHNHEYLGILFENWTLSQLWSTKGLSHVRFCVNKIRTNIETEIPNTLREGGRKVPRRTDPFMKGASTPPLIPFLRNPYLAVPSSSMFSFWPPNSQASSGLLSQKTGILILAMPFRSCLRLGPCFKVYCTSSPKQRSLRNKWDW